jgi:hypothetical protein
MHIRRATRLAFVLAASATLGACAAADVALNHSNLAVQTHMSESVFLDPVPPAAKTIYVTARNTSDHPEIDLRGPLTQSIAGRGYRIVDDPNAAHYMLRINILQAGPIDSQAKNDVLAAKYGEPLLAGAAAAATTGVLGGGAGAMTGVGLGVAAASFLANQLVQNVTFSVVVDIQLSERPLSGQKVASRTTTVSSGANSTAQAMATPGGYAAQGSYNSRATVQSVSEMNAFKQYQIRTVAYADKMNLRIEEAVPVLVARLSSSLSNLFE